MGVYGKTCFYDFVFRQSLPGQRFLSVLIGNQPKVRGGFTPGGVDFDGVCDDGEDRNSLAKLLENALSKIGVKRVGADNRPGLIFNDEFAQFCLGFAHQG